MIDSLTQKLTNNGYIISDKVIVDGFSGGGMWANRYTLLHSERVKLAVIGQAGGWLVMPIKEYKGKELNWLHGLADYKELTGNEYDKY